MREAVNSAALQVVLFLLFVSSALYTSSEHQREIVNRFPVLQWTISIPDTPFIYRSRSGHFYTANSPTFSENKLSHKLYIRLLLLFWWWGPISTAVMRAYCTLTPPLEFHHSSPETLHTKRRERPLLAKDGTKVRKFS
jgi:hypothetical protein